MSEQEKWQAQKISEIIGVFFFFVCLHQAQTITPLIML